MGSPKSNSLDEKKMKISEILKNNTEGYSFEIFPPKTPEGELKMEETLQRLAALKPDFISVTMGAMGSNQRSTFSLVEKIQNQFNIPALAHLTCVNLSHHQIDETLKELKTKGIENLLCLRGDPPGNQAQFHPPADGFAHASDLIEYIRHKTASHFSIAAAAYPEGHISAKSLEEDLSYTKLKVDLGADFLITQLFLKNEYFLNFCQKLKEKGISIPILPGIMPINSYKQLEIFSQICGCKIPEEISGPLSQIQEETQKIKEFGIRYAVQQVQDLQKLGLKRFHYYILNQADTIEEILRTILNRTQHH